MRREKEERERGGGIYILYLNIQKKVPQIIIGSERERKRFTMFAGNLYPTLHLSFTYLNNKYSLSFKNIYITMAYTHPLKSQNYSNQHVNKSVTPV